MSNSNVSIGVSADVSEVQSELAKVESAAKRVNDALNAGEVGLDAEKAKKDLADLDAAAKALAKSLESADKSGTLSGIDASNASKTLQDAAAAADGLKNALDYSGAPTSGINQAVKTAGTLEDHFKRAAKAQAVLNREGVKATKEQTEAYKRRFDMWRKSGARGTSRIKDQEFDEWLDGGWRNYSVNQNESRGQRNKILQSIGVTGGPHSGGRFGGYVTSLLGRSGARVLGAIPGGSTVTGSMAQAGAAEGGLMSGAGMARLGAGLGVGALAYGAIKLVQGISGGMDRTKGEGADYTDLRQALGATVVGFDELRTSVRHFSEGMGLSYNELAKIAKQYGKEAGIYGKAGYNIGKEVGDAAAFGRGYGIDPSQTAQFMAVMRRVGVTDGDKGNAKLALQIGEAMQKGQTSGKIDEVLSAVQSYSVHAARTSLTAPNLDTYLSFMSSMTGLGLPGLKSDPTNAAAAMNQADAALRQGGAFGEASQNFSLGMWQRRLSGFTALDMDYLNEQGAFGSVSKAFGRDSAAYGLAKQRGDDAKMAQYDRWADEGGDQSILSLQMRALEQEYGNNIDGFRKAIQSHLGVGAGQASALYSAYKNDKGLGGLQRQLESAGVSDPSKINLRQIASLSELANTDKSGLLKQAQKLSDLKGADALSSQEAGELRKAIKGDENELRKVVLNLSSKHNTTADEGDHARRQTADLDNIMQDIATKIVPWTMAIKDGIIEIVRKFSPESKFIKDMDRMRAEEERAKIEAADPIEKEIGDRVRTAVTERKSKGLPVVDMPEETRKKMRAIDDELVKVNPEWKPGMTEAQILTESGGNPRALSNRDARGLAQVIPQTQHSLEARFKRTLDPYNVDDSLLMYKELMKENLGKFGNIEDAQKAYNGGWDRKNWNNAETSAYPRKIDSYHAALAKRDAPNAMLADAKKQEVSRRILDDVKPSNAKDRSDKINESHARVQSRDDKLPDEARSEAKSPERSSQGIPEAWLPPQTFYLKDPRTGAMLADPILQPGFKLPVPSGANG